MALNLDTAIRLSAQVKGLDQFKNLTDRLLGVKSGSESASGAVQQLSGESTRLSQESVKAASGARVQAAALQDLQTKARASGAEARRTGGEYGVLGGVFQRLRGQSGGLFDGVTQSSGKAANGIREFQRTIQLTDADLARMREQQLQLAASSKTTELSLKQQAEALNRLRKQAEVGGSVYKALSGDIAKLQAASRGLDGATQQNSQSIAQQIQSLTALQASLQRTGQDLGATGQQITALKQRAAELGQAWEPGIRGLKLLAKVQAETVDQQAAQTTRLQGILGKAGEGYQRLGREIEALKQKAAGLDLSKGLSITPGGVASGLGGAVRNIVQLRQDLAKSMPGRVVLTGEGIATAGVAGAAGMGAASGLGGMASGAQAVAGGLDAIAAKAAALPGVLKPLGGLLSEPANAAAAGVAQWAGALTAAQAKLQALAGPFEAIGTAIGSIGPEASAAAGVASLAIAGVYQVLKRQADAAQADLEQSFQGISDAAQKTLTDLVRIYDRVPNARLEAQQQLRDRNLQRLGEVPSDSVEARRAANAVATAEREIERIQLQQQNLLERARSEENRRTDAAREQLGLARQRLTQQQADTRLAQEAYNWEWLRNREAAARTRASSGNPAAVQDARLRLEDQRRATAEAQASRTWEWLRNREARARIGQDEALMARSAAADAAAADDLRRRAAAAFPAPRVLALPAAGQTSFVGTVNAQGLGGGARRLSNYETAGTRDVIGSVMGTGRAGNGVAQAAAQTRGKLAELFITIDKVTAASNGSISSLQRQRSAWEALRNAVNPAAPAYARATREVETLDKRLQALTGTQEKAQRKGIGREAFGSAVGSLAAGGGLQGAVGALAGGLAFSGSAAGLAAGAGVSVALGAGMLASRVGVEAETAQIRLKALTDQFGEYNQAQAAAARISQTLRVSTVEAQDGFGKLYAALRPTGVTVKEIEDAFVGFTAAARASGATAEESSAALLQLKQALGSGVLQGDELRSIREQAPAVGQAIAKEMGVTIGELKKLGSEGKITTDIVLRALARLRNEKLGQLNAQFSSSAQAIKDLQIATEDFGRTLARVFGPYAVALLRNFTAALEDANLTFHALSGNAGSEQIVQLRQQARAQAERDTNARPFAWWDTSGKDRFFRQREQQLFRQLQQNRPAAGDTSTSEQQSARAEAAAERQAARARAAEEASKKERDNEKKFTEQLYRQQLDFQNDLTKIRMDAEKRLADFRMQSLERARQMERDLADQRLGLERSTDELRRRADGQRQDFYLNMERANLAAMGGNTSGLDIEIEMIQSRRRASEEILKNEQTATDRKLQLDRAIEDYKVSVAKGIREILVDAADRWSERMRKGAEDTAETIRRAGQSGGATAAVGAAAGRYMQGNIGPTSTGDHFHVMRRDGSFYPRGALDRYVEVNGRPLSSGLTVSGGDYGAPRSYGAHSGRDYAFSRGASLGLTNGARWIGNKPGTSVGDRTAFMTPDGNVYEIIHGRFAGSIAAIPANGIRPLAAAQRSTTAMPALNGAATAPPATPGIDAARAKLNAAIGADQAAGNAVALNQPLEELQSRYAQITQELGQQRRASHEQLEDYQRMLALQRNGLTPELAQQSVERGRMAEREALQLQTLQAQAAEYLKQTGLTDQQKQAATALLEATQSRLDALPDITGSLDREAVAMTRLRDLEEQRQRLAQGLADTIGNGLGSAMEGLISGTERWGNSLREIGATVLKDIAKQLLQVALVQPATTGLKGLISGLLPTVAGSMAGGSGVAASSSLAGYTAPLLAGLPGRATGGPVIGGSPYIVGERGPELFIPGPSGTIIPNHQLSGSNAAPISVSVSVDATGSSVQGDAGQGQQLGRVVAAAVQAELIKQRRPGGILAG